MTRKLGFIEIALWDLAGKILSTPACNLLGGRFRDRVRFYRTTQIPKEGFRSVSFPTNLETARNSARDTAKRERLKVFIFEIGKPLVRVDEEGNEIAP